MKKSDKIMIFVSATLCGIAILVLLLNSEPAIELSDTEIAVPPNTVNSVKTEYNLDYIVHFKRSTEETKDGKFTVSLVTDGTNILSRNPDGGFTLKLDTLRERAIDLKDFRKTLKKWAKAYAKKQKEGTVGASLEALADLYIQLLNDTLSYNLSFLLVGDNKVIYHILRKANSPDFVTGGEGDLRPKMAGVYELTSNLVLRYIHRLFTAD